MERPPHRHCRLLLHLLNLHQHPFAVHRRHLRRTRRARPRRRQSPDAIARPHRYQKGLQPNGMDRPRLEQTRPPLLRPPRRPPRPHLAPHAPPAQEPPPPRSPARHFSRRRVSLRSSRRRLTAVYWSSRPMPSWYARRIQRYEQMRFDQEPKRRTLPFGWGIEHLGGDAADPHPEEFLNRYVAEAVAASDRWYAVDPAADYSL